MKIYYLYVFLSGYREFIHIINYYCMLLLYHIVLDYSRRHVKATRPVCLFKNRKLIMR